MFPENDDDKLARNFGEMLGIGCAGATMQLGVFNVVVLLGLAYLLSIANFTPENSIFIFVTGFAFIFYLQAVPKKPKTIKETFRFFIGFLFFYIAILICLSMIFPKLPQITRQQQPDPFARFRRLETPKLEQHKIPLIAKPIRQAPLTCNERKKVVMSRIEQWLTLNNGFQEVKTGFGDVDSTGTFEWMGKTVNLRQPGDARNLFECPRSIKERGANWCFPSYRYFRKDYPNREGIVCLYEEGGRAAEGLGVLAKPSKANMQKTASQPR